MIDKVLSLISITIGPIRMINHATKAAIFLCACSIE